MNWLERVERSEYLESLEGLIYHNHLSVKATEAPVAVHGHLQVRINGEIVCDQSNLIVTTGHNMLAARFHTNTSPPDPISHVAIGTDNTAEADGNTALGTQVHRKAWSAFTRSNNVLTLTASFGDGEGEGLIAEAGLFNAATSGTMFARTRLNPARQKATSDVLDLTWTLTF